EVTKLLVQYAFDKLNLNKVYLGVNVENIGAVKSYEKTGFVHEGRLREEVYRNGRYYDVHKMSILRSEWLKTKSNAEQVQLNSLTKNIGSKAKTRK
ncbi:MAG: GNAT family protein, partial [Nanoarchaeota archaeon]